MAVEIAPDS